jgi:hypothetical protein
VVASGAKLVLVAVLPLARTTRPAFPIPIRACGPAPDPLTAGTNRIYAQVRDEVPA